MRLRRAGWLAQDSGQGMAEYALILALASLGVVFALLILQDSIGTTFQGTSQRIDAATAGAGGGGTETGAGRPGTADGADGGGYGHGHGNGKGNSGNGYGNGGPNGKK